MKGKELPASPSPADGELQVSTSRGEASPSPEDGELQASASRGEVERREYAPCRQLMMNILRLVLNGIAISCVPYFTLLSMMFGLSLVFIVPLTLVGKGSLMVIERIANQAAKLALEGGKTDQLEKEDEEEPEVESPLMYLCNYILDLLWRAFLITLMFITDFLVLFSIMVNVTYMFPRASLPPFDADIFRKLNVGMPGFMIEFVIWMKGIFSSLQIPDFELRCKSFNVLASLFSLFLTALLISIIISSDIVAVVFDRQNRLGNTNEVHPKKSFLERFWVNLKRKFSQNVVDASQFLIWQAVTLITNNVSIYIILNLQRLNDPKGGKERSREAHDWLAEEEECTWGMHSIAVFMVCYIGICTAIFIVRVVTGLFYKDGTWILTASIVQEESFFTRSSAQRLVAILKLSLGSFLLPFPGASLGLTKDHMVAMREQFYKQRTVVNHLQQQGKEDDPEVQQQKEDDPEVKVEKVERSVLMFCPVCLYVTTDHDIRNTSSVKHKNVYGGKADGTTSFWSIFSGRKCLHEQGMQRFWEHKPQYICSKCEWKPDCPPANPPTQCPTCQATVFVEGVYDLTDEGAENFVRLTDKVVLARDGQPESDPKKHMEKLVQKIVIAQSASTDLNFFQFLKKQCQTIVGFFAVRKIVAEALLDLAVNSEEFEGLGVDKIQEEYRRLHYQEFDISNVSDFRLVDFLNASIAAFERRQKLQLKCRLRHFISMPWGVLLPLQFPMVHASERCILWRSQVEQVARASGMSYAITIFAVPFIGPFLGKAFMYFNENAAFVRSGNELKAAAYTYKQEPPNNKEWCEKGSQGLKPSNWLKALWCFSVLKLIMLYLAVYLPSMIVEISIVVFIMSLISGNFVKREQKIWKERDELLDGVRQKKVRIKKIHLRNLATQKKELARKNWEKRFLAEEKKERTDRDARLFRDEVQEYELDPLPHLVLERTRVGGYDGVCKEVEELVSEVVELNGKLREHVFETRKNVHQRTKDLSTDLKKKAAKHQDRHPVVKGFMKVFMPSVAERFAEMQQEVTEIHEETLNSVMHRKISQWKLFLSSLSEQDVDLAGLQQELKNLLPVGDIEKVKNKVENLQVKNLEFEVEVAPLMKPVSFDVSACCEGQAADVMQQEVEPVKAIVEMAVAMIIKAFEFLKKAKDMWPRLEEEGKKAREKTAAHEKDEELEVAELAAFEPKARFKDFTFMLPAEELEKRLLGNMKKVEEGLKHIQALCLNGLFVLQAIQAACKECQKKLQEAISSSSGMLDWLDPPQLTCCTANAGMMTTVEQPVVRPFDWAEPNEADDFMVEELHATQQVS